MFARSLGIVVVLEVEPALGIGAEIGPKPKSGINRYTAQPFDDFVDTTGGNTDRFGKRVLAEPHGLEPVFQQDDSRVDEGDLPFHRVTVLSDSR